jgi:hypothetical protein
VVIRQETVGHIRLESEACGQAAETIPFADRIRPDPAQSASERTAPDHLNRGTEPFPLIADEVFEAPATVEQRVVEIEQHGVKHHRMFSYFARPTPQPIHVPTPAPYHDPTIAAPPVPIGKQPSP